MWTFAEVRSPLAVRVDRPAGLQERDGQTRMIYELDTVPAEVAHA